jgi:hypothetical protein
MPSVPPSAWPLELIFSLANALAFISWLALALTPLRAAWAPRVRLATGRVVPTLLAVAYVVLIVRHWGPGGYSSLAEVSKLFDVPGLVLAGWLHYLAFDLFVGTWIAQRAADDGLPRWLLLPLLALTFLFGPAGLLAHEIVRAVRRRGAAATGQPELAK